MLSQGYKELITKRPEKPIEHFIYHILSKVPTEVRIKNATLSEFYQKYEQTDLNNVKNVDPDY